MLDVDFLGAVAGEGGDDLEAVAEVGGVLLRRASVKSIMSRSRSGTAHLPLLLVDVVLGLLPAAEEQQSLTNAVAVLGLLSALLHETTERRDTGTGTDHDDRLCGI